MLSHSPVGRKDQRLMRPVKVAQLAFGSMRFSPNLTWAGAVINGLAG